jgi:drug/metabolite transporter (DMT)-like permease
VRWGTATGGLIASYTVVDAYAVKSLGIAPVVLDWFSNLLRFFLLAPLVIADPRRAIAAMRGYWWIAVGVGLLSPLSYILVLAALTSGAPLSLVAPMREMSMMVGALMGMVILREKVGPWRLAGCAVLIAGVILLSGG